MCLNITNFIHLCNFRPINIWAFSLLNFGQTKYINLYIIINTCSNLKELIKLNAITVAWFNLNKFKIKNNLYWEEYITCCQKKISPNMPKNNLIDSNYYIWNYKLIKYNCRELELKIKTISALRRKPNTRCSSRTWLPFLLFPVIIIIEVRENLEYIIIEILFWKIQRRLGLQIASHSTLLPRHLLGVVLQHQLEFGNLVHVSAAASTLLTPV